MTDKRQFRAIKGTRDIPPPDSALWNWFEQKAREVFESYGFRDIRLPIFEDTDLFARSVGADTDIVGKEMYTFHDHGLRHLEWMRNSIVLLRPAYGDPNSVQFFHSQIGSLSAHIRIASERGEMPKT